MGWPGVGAPCGRSGTPGRGATGAPGPAGRGCESLATKSGRGGTIGRAAGWPARPGRMAGVRACGAPGAGTECDCAMGADRAVGGGAPVTTRTGSGGRTPAGNGWRGPDRICPGRGGGGVVRGTSRMGAPGVGVLAGEAATGAAGDAGDVASGGRKRCGCGAIRGASLSAAGASRPAGSASRAASATSDCGLSGAGGAATGSSTTAVAAPFEPGCSAPPPPPPPKIWRNFSATSSSIELE